jgi:hypothetical protein
MRAFVVCAAFPALLLPAALSAQTMSLTESEVLARLAAESPRVLAARAAVDVVRADIVAAGRFPNPRVTFNREAVAGIAEHILTVSQVLPVTGRRRLDVSAATARVEASSHRADDQIRRVRADLRLAFTNLWAAQERERELARTRDRLNELAGIRARRERAGEAAGFDTLRAERDVIDVDASRAIAMTERAQAQAILGSFLAIRREPVVIEAVRPAVHGDMPPPLDELIARAETSRGELIALAREFDASALAERAAGLPGTNITIGQPISHRIDHMLSGTRANIAVKIVGEDLVTLRRLGERVRDVMAGIDGVADVALEQQMDIPVVRFVLNRPAIARYGLRIQDVAAAIETSFGGTMVGRVFDRGVAFDLIVKLDPASAADFERIADLAIDTPTGDTVPIRLVADVRREMGANMIQRENVQRRIVVSCNVAGRDLGSVVSDIQDTVAEQIRMPAGYRVEYGGQFESQQSATERLSLLGGAAIAGVFMMLVLAFGRARDALLVMINLPLALIGGVAGVFLAGGVLSVASMIGFITLFGIATRNGIMLVSHIRQLMEVEGVASLREAVERPRPC